MSAAIRIAFIGLGKHAFLLAESANSCAHIEISACYSLHPKDCQQFAAQFNCTIHESLDAICKDPSIDAAVIVTPNDLHAEQCLRLAQHGKHLFVEKPICNTLADTDRVIKACADADVLLAVGHQERRHPVYRKMKEMIDSGVCGAIYSFEANHCGNLIDAWPHDDWRFSSDHGTGPILHKGIHKIDVLNYLFGRADSVSTEKTDLSFNQDMHETTVSALRYGNQTVGSLSTGFRYNNQSLNIYGELQSMFYSGYGPSMTIKNEKSWERHDIECGKCDPLTEELSEFASAIQGDASIEVDGHVARESLLLAIAATESANQQRPLSLTDINDLCYT